MEVEAFVKKALALRVDDDAERVVCFWNRSPTCAEIAKGRRVQIPGDGSVRARPMAVHRRTQIERHLQAMAQVLKREPRTLARSQLGQIPRPHLGVGLEPALTPFTTAFRPRVAATGPDGAPARLPLQAPLSPHGQRCHRRRPYGGPDAVARARSSTTPSPSSLPPPRDMAGEPAPEFELAVISTRNAWRPRLN